ncbi:MAG: Sel1 domain protein repeat-containing protein [Streptosporangiaceae bacterium]|jgi:hypothetical protein|nr:Sel1 domain protein repeat-containing protein [Streptosporangiaceae bacterium]
MSIDDPDNQAALDEFVQCLAEFHRACGGPSLRELSRVSRQVVETYRMRYPNLLELSLTALSDVLSRRRKKPPSWNWVASFVLSCQRYAEDSGLFPDVGDSTLQEWNRRLQTLSLPGEDAGTGAVPGARAPIGRAGALPSGPAVPDRPMRPRPPDPLPAPVPTVQEAADPRSGGGSARRPRTSSQVAAGTAIGELLDHYVGDPGGASLSELRFFSNYGRHGLDLLRAAEGDRDGDACYRLGVLLCLDDRPTESLAWLMQAESGGDARASRLIEHHAPRTVAPGHAYELGVLAAAAGDPASAEIYLERAVRAGHARAGFELGALWLERHDPARAVYWFSRAAAFGHPLAQWWSDRIRQETSAGGSAVRPRQPGREISLPTVADLLQRIHGEQPPQP